VLLRVQSGPKFAVEEVLADASFLTRVFPRRGKGKKRRALRVRVIPYGYTHATGTFRHSRLLTSLLDAASHAATRLVALYHQRWEQEGVFREIKSALAGRVTQVRAHDPLRALQELDGLLLGHFILRHALLEAARNKGVTPVTLSFSGVLRVLQTRLGAVPADVAQGAWWQRLLEEMALQSLPPHRRRRCPRKKKVTRQLWPTKRPEDKEEPLPVFVVVSQPAA
jgi:hypothetical protein